MAVVAGVGVAKEVILTNMFYIGRSPHGYSYISSEFIWISDNDFGAFTNNPKSMQIYYLNLFESVAKKYNHTFRIYLTAHGMRSFIVDKINISNAIYLLREVGTDLHYVMSVLRKGEFRCRISPKTKNLPKNFAITKYLTTVGNRPIIEEVKKFIDFHDFKTSALSEFQLV